MPQTQAPISTDAAILARVIQGNHFTLTPEVASALIQLRFTDEDCKHMHELAVKNQRGQLSAQEVQDLDSYVRVGRFLDLLAAKARKSLKTKQ